jgi:hypothetical protein
MEEKERLKGECKIRGSRGETVEGESMGVRIVERRESMGVKQGEGGADSSRLKMAKRMQHQTFHSGPPPEY